MLETKFTFLNESGFHARPASNFAMTASNFESKIFILKGNKTYSGKSVLGILGMGAKKGTEITLHVDGTDEAEATEVLLGLLNNLE